MRIVNPKLKKLVEKYDEISTLGKIGGVLGWDLNVNLPPKAAEGRARQSALLEKVVVDHWRDPEFKKLFYEVEEISSNLNEVDKAAFRNIAHAAHYYFNVPEEIIVEKVKTSSQAFMVWQEARKNNKFADFEPYLEKLVHLSQLEAEHLGFEDNPYDALLDLYEQNLTAKMCEEIFGKLQPPLTKILKKIRPSEKDRKARELVKGENNYPTSNQRQIALFIAKKMGYDLQAGGIHISPHPFTTTLDRHDVRITTAYHEDDFRDSFSSTVHETGHALYEQGVNTDFTDTPLDGGISLGIHESQSRFWENIVGRSPEFLEFMTPVFQAFYPEQLAGVGTETLIALFNQVKPGFIRIEADEVSYNLHIILRFQIENALINNKLKVKEIPEVWREKMKKYLGVVPPTDREGALQDVHWSYGNFGYFPTYSLGNLYAAQITNTMKKELDLPAILVRGELGTILSWLRENVHQYGSLYWPDELIKKVTGEPLNPKYFIDYIEDKYGKIYNLK